MEDHTLVVDDTERTAMTLRPSPGESVTVSDYMTVGTRLILTETHLVNLDQFTQRGGRKRGRTDVIIRERRRVGFFFQEESPSSSFPYSPF